jgi:hypothetical protein
MRERPTGQVRPPPATTGVMAQPWPRSGPAGSRCRRHHHARPPRATAATCPACALSRWPFVGRYLHLPRAAAPAAELRCDCSQRSPPPFGDEARRHHGKGRRQRRQEGRGRRGPAAGRARVSPCVAEEGGAGVGERVAVANLYMVMLSWNKFYDFLKHESLFSKF